MITLTPSGIFQYLRGAVRGAYGKENFQDKNILLIKMNKSCQDVLVRLRETGANLYFMDQSMQSYYKALTLCNHITPWGGETMDIVLDFHKNVLVVRGLEHSLGAVKTTPYESGIHDFYSL